MKVKRVIKKEKEVPGLGGKIKQAREASDKSLTKLAKEAGVSRSYWYQLESESTIGDSVAEETLRKIEEVLNVDFGVTLD